jgi:translation initiation factor IF-2
MSDGKLTLAKNSNSGEADAITLPEKKKLTLGRSGTLAAPASAGHSNNIRQPVAGGVSKTIQVEVRKKRSIVEGHVVAKPVEVVDAAKEHERELAAQAKREQEARELAEQAAREAQEQAEEAARQEQASLDKEEQARIQELAKAQAREFTDPERRRLAAIAEAEAIRVMMAGPAKARKVEEAKKKQEEQDRLRAGEDEENKADAKSSEPVKEPRVIKTERPAAAPSTTDAGKKKDGCKRIGKGASGGTRELA